MVAEFSAKFSINLTLAHILVIGVVLWVVFGDPLINVANLFWKTGPAPWEEVDLIYYPDKTNRSVAITTTAIGNLEDCRAWAGHQSTQHDDRYMERGDYDCSVGFTPLFSSTRVYRLSLN